MMPKHIEKQFRKWYAVKYVPRDVQEAFDGKTRLKQCLHTESETEALTKAKPIIADWERAIAVARKGGSDKAKALEYRGRLLSLKSEEERELEIEHIILPEAVDIEHKHRDQAKAKQFYDVATGNLTLTKDLVDDWAEANYTGKLKDEYKRLLERVAEQYEHVEEVTPDRAQQFINRRLEHLAVSTVRKMLAGIKGYWNWLIEQRHVNFKVNPWASVRLPSKRRAVSKGVKRRAFEDNDIKKLLDNSEGTLRDLILVGAYTGARIDELCSLTVEQCEGDVLRIREAKTEAGNRNVPIHSAIKQTIERLIQSSSDGFLFSGLPGDNKYEDRSKAIGQRFGRLKTRLGFGKELVFHSLRKSFATKLDNALVPEQIAARLLGHEHEAMSFGTYSSGSVEQILKDAIERVRYK